MAKYIFIFKQLQFITLESSEILMQYLLLHRFIYYNILNPYNFISWTYSV